MDQQITDQEYKKQKNIDGLNVSITVTLTGQSNNQLDMNMYVNSQQMNQVPFVQSLIINNQNVLIQNNNKFENQPNNFFFNQRKKVIKNISEIIQDNEKGETLHQQIKSQDYEQNIRIIANQEQNIQNLYREINDLKQVIQQKDDQIKQYSQNNSNQQLQNTNQQLQNIISPPIQRPKIKILDEAPLKPQKIINFKQEPLTYQNHQQKILKALAGIYKNKLTQAHKLSKIPTQL